MKNELSDEVEVVPIGRRPSQLSINNKWFMCVCVQCTCVVRSIIVMVDCLTVCVYNVHVL